MSSPSSYREGVAVYRRLSPPLLIQLMQLACTQTADFYESLDPFAGAAIGVSWAGETTSLVWFDNARELTERWHHQEQIRLATKRPGIMIPALYHPVLDTFLRGLPIHGFSFPLRYFAQHGLPLDWQVFLDDFQRHWPTDEDHTYVDFVREGSCGNAARRWGDPHWRRITEVRASAKSVFHFDVQGSVAKSTHAGIPWLRYIRQRLGDQIHFWPFDGWSVPPHSSVIAEVYPALWNKSFPVAGRTPHQHDAFSIAEWLRRADANGTLMQFFCPDLEPSERQTAAVEGWILGVL